jgi:DNA-binding MarR family transcriptional regulator
MKKISTTQKNKHKNLEEALMAFRHAMTSALMQEAKKRGCSLSHFEVINYIAEEGSPTMKDIAKQLHITPPSASALVDTLVSKRLVTRSQTPEDRRTIRVVLTPKAQIFLLSIHKHKSSVFNTMLFGLSVEDKNNLARILIKCT